MQPSERDAFCNGLIPELEHIHDYEPTDAKRDILWKAICIVEEHSRRHAERALTGADQREQAE